MIDMNFGCWLHTPGAAKRWASQMADPKVFKDRVASLNEDGTDGPLVDRLSVPIEDFIVGQDRKSEELKLAEENRLKQVDVTSARP